MTKTVERDRFGQPITPTIRGTVRKCTSCHTIVESVEIPAGYLNDPYWGPYLCGDCAATKTTTLERTPA